MKVVETIKEMKEMSNRLSFEGKSVGLVPTMGALHEGHLSLVRASVNENDVTIVSIFVNPMQFGQGEDFDQYPRTLQEDMEKLLPLNTDVVFAPAMDIIYPEGFNTHIEVRKLSDKLCGAFRPVHFGGVATVVTKLFNITKPAKAYFGLKDYQQTLIIKKMVKDLNMDVEVITCPTIREKDGLAMSSRNKYLTSEERKDALLINKALTKVKRGIEEGSISTDKASEKLREILCTGSHITDIQYASAYDPETLEEINGKSFVGRSILLAIALKAGKTRLIDNISVNLNR